MEALLLDCIWLQSHHIQLPQATEWYGGETICQALSLQPGAFPEATLSVAHCVQAIVLGRQGSCRYTLPGCPFFASSHFPCWLLTSEVFSNLNLEEHYNEILLW